MSDGLTYTGPINPDPAPDEASIIIYTYVPSLALAVVGVVTFALIFIVNLYYVIVKRGRGYRSFHILILVGAVSPALHQTRFMLTVSGNGGRRVWGKDRQSLSSIRRFHLRRAILPDRSGGCHQNRRATHHADESRHQSCSLPRSTSLSPS